MDTNKRITHTRAHTDTNTHTLSKYPFSPHRFTPSICIHLCGQNSPTITFNWSCVTTVEDTAIALMQQADNRQRALCLSLSEISQDSKYFNQLFVFWFCPVLLKFPMLKFPISKAQAREARANIKDVNMLMREEADSNVIASSLKPQIIPNTNISLPILNSISSSTRGENSN